MRVILLALLWAGCALAAVKEMKKMKSMEFKERQTSRIDSQASMAIGTSFAYAYLNNHLNANVTSYTENLFLTISNPGTQQTNVVITTNYQSTQTNQTVTVAAGLSVTVQIQPPDIQADYKDLGLDKIMLEDKGIFVNSDQPVKLVATNQRSDGSGEDKFAVFPICQLGTLYMIIGDESGNHGGPQSTNIFTVIAVEDNTVVNTTFNKNAVLHKGESLTYAMQSQTSTASVRSSKPVAVISGSVCGYGIYDLNLNFPCSHEALMLYPFENWDTQYPVFGFLPNYEVEFLLVPTVNNTIVSFDEYRYILDSSYYYSFWIGDGINIQANNPIFVVTIGKTDPLTNNSAPFLAHVQSPSRLTQGPVLFATGLNPDEANNMVHYARVVTHLFYIGTIVVDSYQPNGLIYTRMGRGDYYFVDVPIQAGEHTVTATNALAKFGVTVYGYGKFRSYAFTPGLNLQNIGQC